MKILVRMIVGFVILVVAACAFVIYQVADDRQRACQTILDIAEDEEEIAYLYQWIDETLKDETILEYLGFDGRAEHHPGYNNKKFRSLGVDWGLLGIDVTYANVTVTRTPDDWNDFTNPDNIQAVQFGEGRNSITLKLDPAFEIKSVGGEEWRHKVRIINDRVSVYCD